MNDFICLIEDLAERYGLKITSIDGTDITLMVRMEVVPGIFLQVYRNFKRGKLNMALVVGNKRIYGFDNEGGVPHEHPCEDPESHVPSNRELQLEEFVLNSLKLLQSEGML